MARRKSKRAARKSARESAKERRERLVCRICKQIRHGQLYATCKVCKIITHARCLGYRAVDTRTLKDYQCPQHLISKLAPPVGISGSDRNGSPIASTSATAALARIDQHVAVVEESVTAPSDTCQNEPQLMDLDNPDASNQRMSELEPSVSMVIQSLISDTCDNVEPTSATSLETAEADAPSSVSSTSRDQAVASTSTIECGPVVPAAQIEPPSPNTASADNNDGDSPLIIHEHHDDDATDCEREEDETDYLVEKIVGHRGSRPGSRWFEIKWTDYDDSSNSWLKEKDLENCIAMLKAYLLRHKLKPTPLKEKLGGCSNPALFNRANWVSTDRVLELVKQYQNIRTYAADIDVREFKGLIDVDCIHVLLHGAHFYVLLHLPKNKTCYIADGSNIFHDDETTRHEIQALVGSKINSIKVDLLLNADNCGSAAVMIALVFRQFYRSRSFPNEIHLTGLKMLETIKSRLHPEKSRGLEIFNIGKAKSLACKYCKKTYRFHQGSNLRMHEAKCKL